MNEMITQIVNIAQRIKESETPYIVEYLYDYESAPPIERVRELYEKEGITWYPLIEEDVQNVLNGYRMQYFLADREFVELYRINHSAHIERRGGTLLGINTLDRGRRHLDAIQAQVEHFGVSLSQFGYGFACFAECQHFYQSQEWKNRAKAIRCLWNYKCNICKRRNVGPLHVHHNTPIVSAYHHSFYLNFADHKLETLCEQCHQEFHARTVRGHGHYGFIFVEPEEVRAERGDFRLLQKAHDELKFCPFCFGYRAGWDDRYSFWPYIDDSGIANDEDDDE